MEILPFCTGVSDVFIVKWPGSISSALSKSSGLSGTSMEDILVLLAMAARTANIFIYL